MVVETNWPAVCNGVTLSEKFPISAAGQSQWLNEVKNIVNSLPNGRGTGVLYWEPGWIGNANLGSSCSVSSRVILTRLRITKVDNSGRLARRPIWKYPLEREYVRCLTSRRFDSLWPVVSSVRTRMAWWCAVASAPIKGFPFRVLEAPVVPRNEHIPETFPNSQLNVFRVI